MRTSPTSFQSFRIHHNDGIEQSIYSFSYRNGRVTARWASEDYSWMIDRGSRDAPSADVAWRAVVELLKGHRTPRILESCELEKEVTIKHWDDWRAQAIAAALLHDEWDGENVYADMLLSFSDAQLEQIWLDYDRWLLGDFVSSLGALRFLELDDFATFRTENLGRVFAEHGYLPDGNEPPGSGRRSIPTAQEVLSSLHREVERRKRESVGVVDRAKAKRPGYTGPFEDFEIGIQAFFAQPWDVQYSFSIDSDAVFRFEFTSKGTLEWNDLSYRQLHGSSAWRAALRTAASLDIGMLCPDHLRSFELGGWNDWRAELVVVALLRDKFRMESRYGRALLSLTVKQAKQLHKEFGSFIERPYAFIEFLKQFRAVDAAPGYDRDDLRRFLERYGYGTPRVTTRKVIARAEKEHRKAVALRPPEPEPPARKGRLIDLGFVLAEELGHAGVTLTSVGRGVGGAE